MVIFSDFDIFTQLKAASFGTQLVHLHWIGNSDNENIFRIERKSIYSEFVEIGNVGQDVTFFTDRGGNLYAGGTFSIAKKSLSTPDSANSNTYFTEFAFKMEIISENT